MPSGWTSNTDPPTTLREWKEGDGVSDMGIIVVAVVAFVFIVVACCWLIQAGKRMVRHEEKGKTGEGANLIGFHDQPVTVDHTEPAASPEGVASIQEVRESVLAPPGDVAVPAVDGSVPPTSTSGYVEYSHMDNLPPTQYSTDNQNIAVGEDAQFSNPPQVQVEHRIDPEDGKLYTLEDFEQEYGEEGRQLWDAQIATSEYLAVDVEGEVEIPEQAAPIVYSEDF
eukprot:TRINITY_DN16064_c0_g1_i1.p1 TRINITY_DN16064_c0_g1~~TRINITY_DN16064_c0_g1_i1.p1  ORF type:complete len:225 (+),score=45.15 TRINITY_DN16064_c0_g1_i1:46-720(+)